MWLFVVKLWLIANASIISSASPVAGKDVLKCSARNLKRFDCWMKSGPNVVQVTKNKILLSDGVGRAVEELPLEKILEWQDVELKKYGSRLFLIMNVWDEGQGETKIQSRCWFVVEVLGLKTNVVLRKLMQKRTPQEGGKYLMDKPEPIELKQVKGQIHWRVGNEKGVIE